MLESILKILFIGFMSGVKFVAAAPIALAYGYNYIETLTITSFGGIVGVLVFFQISKLLTNFIAKAKLNVKNTIDHQAEIQHNLISTPEKKKKFTWKNKLIVKTVRRFELAGVAFITPVLLSIPLGTFIAFRYFHNKMQVLTYLCISVVFWAIVLSSLTLIF